MLLLLVILCLATGPGPSFAKGNMDINPTDHPSSHKEEDIGKEPKEDHQEPILPQVCQLVLNLQDSLTQGECFLAFILMLLYFFFIMFVFPLMDKLICIKKEEELMFQRT